MQQKTIWMRFLIFGISLFQFLIHISCDGTDNGKKSGTYIYTNNSPQNLILKISKSDTEFQEFEINIGESKTFISRGEDGNFPFFSIDGSVIVADSAILHFNDNKCIVFSRDNTDGIILEEGTGMFNVTNYDDYTPDIVNSKNFTLHYTITESMYDTATPCE